MKEIESLHTLRLYDPEFISSLSLLMKQEQKKHKNKNDFLTALLKRGYEAYVKGDPDERINEVYPLLKDMSEYLIKQSETAYAHLSVLEKLASANYRMLLALMGGEKAIPSKIEDGFFDDIPARFERIAAEAGRERK
jgi:hypothetical protein